MLVSKPPLQSCLYVALCGVARDDGSLKHALNLIFKRFWTFVRHVEADDFAVLIDKELGEVPWDALSFIFSSLPGGVSRP